MNPGHTTRTGLQIGRCYIAPPQRLEGDAIAIQSALLAKDNGEQVERVKSAALSVAITLAAVVGFVSMIFQGAPV